MPTLKNPEQEARRIAVVRAAFARQGPWQRSTGPRTAAGKRKMAGNATNHGAGGLALKLALAYCTAVERALIAYSQTTATSPTPETD